MLLIFILIYIVNLFDMLGYLLLSYFDVATRKCKNACLACKVVLLDSSGVVDGAWEIVIREAEHRFPSWLCNTKTARPWTSHLTSLHLRLVIYKERSIFIY